MAVIELNHPLVHHKLTLMRKKDVSCKEFRELVAELSNFLTYEACRDFPTEIQEIDGWNGPINAPVLSGKKVTIVPILRAGIGMMDGVLRVIPSARVSMLGMQRDETTLEPVWYFERLASNIKDRTALLIDPMLATGGSMVESVQKLKDEGCTSIKVLVLVAAPEGMKALTDAHPDVDVYTAVIDDRLNEKGYILPGLGDAGDKIFGTL